MTSLQGDLFVADLSAGWFVLAELSTGWFTFSWTPYIVSSF